MKRKRPFCMGIVLCVSLSLLTGCESKKVDYGVDGNTENAGVNTVGGKKSLEQFAGAQQWKEDLQARDAAGKTIDFAINADVIIPSAEQMYVIEVKEPDMEEDFKQKVAKQIFGEETVYYNDDMHLPKKALENQLAIYQSEYDFWQREAESDEGAAEMAEKVRSRIEECEGRISVAEDNYTPVTEYTVSEYLGERDGVTYRLTFETGKDDEIAIDNYDFYYNGPVGGTGRVKGFSLTPQNMSDVVPDGIEERAGQWVSWYEGTTRESWYNVKENECKLSQEEAREIAQNFVNTLGLDYTTYGYCVPLCWGERNEIDQIILNGYVFTYNFGIDDLAFGDYGKEWQYNNYVRKKKESEEIQYSIDATLKLYVTDQGVIRALAYNPVEMTGLSEPVELLPINAIKEIMEEEVTAGMEQFRFFVDRNKVQFSEMQLIYFRVRDREHAGHYSYVPTWRLSEMNSTVAELRDGNPLGMVRGIDNPVLINAIDGSVINLYDEL